MRAAAIVVLFVCGTVHAEPITVFGLPLGGKMPYTMKVCASNFPATAVACWAEKQARGKYGMSGSAMLPNPSLPEWATYEPASMRFSRQDILVSISFRDIESSKESVIRTSIEKRFGSPKTLSRYPTGSLTQWAHPDVDIEMVCPAGSDCMLSFTSALERPEREAAKLANEKERLARPLSP